jgi:hypothetical protein
MKCAAKIRTPQYMTSLRHPDSSSGKGIIDPKVTVR